MKMRQIRDAGRSRVEAIVLSLTVLEVARQRRPAPTLNHQALAYGRHPRPRLHPRARGPGRGGGRAMKTCGLLRPRRPGIRSARALMHRSAAPGCAVLLGALQRIEARRTNGTAGRWRPQRQRIAREAIRARSRQPPMPRWRATRARSAPGTPRQPGHARAAAPTERPPDHPARARRRRGPEAWQWRHTPQALGGRSRRLPRARRPTAGAGGDGSSPPPA